MEAEGYTTTTATGEYGLLTVCDPSDANMDICLVHGLTGNLKSTWTHKGPKGAKTFWPEKLLPTDIPRARIMTFGYNAAVVKVLESANTLRDHGNDLATKLSNKRERDGTSNRPIIFIVHSLGGLVTEQALLLCTTNMNDEPKFGSLLKNTYGILFMGTPHGGADKERMGQILRRFAKVLGYDTNKKILEVLNPTSEVLATIEQEFQKHLRFRTSAAFNMPAIKIHNFYESLPVDLQILGFKVSEAGIIVPKESAILDAYLFTKIEASHIEMTKFAGRNDAYDSVVGLLWIWVRDCIAGRQQTQEEIINEVRERRNQRLGQQGQGNVHTLASTSTIAAASSVSVGNATAGGNLNQRIQSAGGDINN